MHWEDLEGTGGEGGGWGDRDGEHMYTYGCFISMYDKIHYKKKKKKKSGQQTMVAMDMERSVDPRDVQEKELFGLSD